MAAKDGAITPETRLAMALFEPCHGAYTLIAPFGIYSLLKASRNYRNGLKTGSVLLRVGLWMCILTALIGLYTLFGPALKFMGVNSTTLLLAPALISMAYMSFFYLYHPKMGGKA